MSIEQATKRPSGAKSKRNGLLRRFVRNREGSTSIEFAILALPFLVVIFASLETFAAFYGDQLLANATETMARKVRTGQITFGQKKDTDMDQAEFRQAFCDEISILMKCSATEAAQPSLFYLDVRAVPDLSQFPVAIPRKAGSTDLDTGDFKFAPGGPGSFNVVRAYYRWSVITDLVRPFVTNLRPAGASMPSDYLMVATATFRNESE
ncbi:MULTISPECIES: TadE/TadG family type IV pilus assembly protein [unclassified Ensifer]|uniref:TadE/TadG family type IV pilus assembly protein n=1 Tax=unclassified Ensifer TaxID=2633371 RepID=UPI000812EDFC|nr:MULTISPECIES: TadE/TadG family type IV pilus assembly protein [unclassified Ensifer]OCO98801.1 pilus assembly protein TadG [Ensifer sp. LC14]OCP13280.1 pilus assembly protein TadG [Ensifer sp. LC13]OCP13881.1 pilus assembly protein TadG [Ensifer sp. LC11]OCP28262.1 pilus assembly protein TadG [Ensifer sp. LC499]